MFILNICFSQQTTVQGVIYEDSTTQKLSFVKLSFQNTQVGTTSNQSGKFKLSIPTSKLKSDTIVVSLIGFKPQHIPIKKGRTNKISIHLISSTFWETNQETSDTTENIALFYLEKVIENKKINNPSNYGFYSSKEYSKVRFDLNNYTDKLKTNFLFKPFDYIWENTQTTDEGVNFLPILLTERLIEHYYRNSPKDSKDIITAEKTTGITTTNLTRFTEDLYFTLNIYDNYVTILDKSFPSPLNDNYQNSYKYSLVDSVKHSGGKTYKIRFRPKKQNELAFIGEMEIDSGSYAITEINFRFTIQANINFVSSYFITNKYAKIDSVHWMMTESNVLGDFTALEGIKDLTGFFGRKHAVFTDFTINEKIDAKKFKGFEILVEGENKDALDSSNWNLLRPEKLRPEELKLLEIRNRIKDDPKFKGRAAILATLATGFIPTNNLQPGNIFTFYTYNPVEYSRFKIGYRSNPRNNFPLDYSAYVAYGVRDKKWKYGGSFAYDFTPKIKPTRIGIAYSYDIQQTGRSFNQIELDHIFSILNQNLFGATRNYVHDLKIYLEKQIVTGVIARAGVFFQEYRSTEFHSYTEFNSPGIRDTISHYSMSGLNFTFKYSHYDDKINGEYYDKENLYRFFRKYPEVSLKLNYSNKNILPTNFDYTKVRMSIKQKVRANKLGHIIYNIEFGKTFGKVPYFMLDTPFGNELILNDVYSFNLMNYMEFVADQFASILLEHHFDGLIFNQIPLINKLKWRSFVFGKSYYGSLSDANRNSNYALPTLTKAFTIPYYEVGFGIENIFKIAKIDFVWRLTPGTGTYYYFMVKPSFKFSF